MADSFKHHLANWPTNKPGDSLALQKFSDFLEQTNSAIKMTKFLECLNSADENQKLVRKLPRPLMERWNHIVNKLLYGSEFEREAYGEVYEGSFPPFSQFCKFVSNEARIACGPGMIRAYEGAKDKNQKSSLTPSAKNFATSVTPDTIKKP